MKLNLSFTVFGASLCDCVTDSLTDRRLISDFTWSEKKKYQHQDHLFSCVQVSRYQLWEKKIKTVSLLMRKVS